MAYKSLEIENLDFYQLESLEVGITSNCNFQCNYCCAYQRNDAQFISGKEIIRILDDIPTLKRIRLSGGEVTLKYQDCLDVVTYCSTRGISTQLNTNGSLLNEDRIRRLRDAGLSNIHISFNFTSADKFSAYYKLPGSVYEKILNNIRLCVALKLETVLETLLFVETQNNIIAISECVYQLGVRIHEIQNGIMIKHSGWNAITARDELKRSMTELIEMKQVDTVLYLTCMDRFFEALGLREQQDVHFSRCIDGKKQLHLHSNGDVLICELCHPVVIGNIYQGTSLKEIYLNKPAPLTDFLNKQPCLALDALYPNGYM